MSNLVVGLRIAALVVFILAAINIPSSKVNLTAAGLALLTLSILI